jgi:hypothetical protein
MKLTAIILVIDVHSYSYKIKTPFAWAAEVRLAEVARQVQHPSIGESRVFGGRCSMDKLKCFVNVAEQEVEKPGMQLPHNQTLHVASARDTIPSDYPSTNGHMATVRGEQVVEQPGQDCAAAQKNKNNISSPKDAPSAYRVEALVLTSHSHPNSTPCLTQQGVIDPQSTAKFEKDHVLGAHTAIQDGQGVDVNLPVINALGGDSPSTTAIATLKSNDENPEVGQTKGDSPSLDNNKD